MNENITQDHVLLLVYGEASATDQKRISEAMATQPELLQYYNELVQTRRMLDSIHEEPHPTSIAIVSEHSHDSHTEAV
ncbi:MAG: hypothetical protein JNL57_02805 [Bacteroidetes bacterium]|nr:hypothetical protein [Bacteroidota bacterium]